MLETKLYTAAQIRELDKKAITLQFNGDGFVLMQRAGLCAFNKIKEIYANINNLLVFCGQGNNGGDGFIIASLAAQNNYHVTVVFLGKTDKLSADSTKAYNIYQSLLASSLSSKLMIIDSFLDLENLASLNNNPEDLDTLYVDALLGTGLNKSPEGIYKSAIDFINTKKNIFAVDIPSGLQADTGCNYSPTVKASATLSFIGLKPGLLTNNGPDYCGRLFFDSLGVDDKIYAEVDYNAWLIDENWIADVIANKLPKRLKNSHKHQYGHVVIVGGDDGMSGAVTMAGQAALRVGAGLVTIITNAKHSAVISQYQPELMVYGVLEEFDLHKNKIIDLLFRANVIVIGPGLGTTQWSTFLFELCINNILENTNAHTIIVDADGLNLLSVFGKNKSNLDRLKKLNNKLLLTPHPGEANRLLNNEFNVSNDRFKAVQLISEYYSAVTILKGVGSLIYSSNNKTALCKEGNPGMATAGMGDVLTGIIAGLTAQGLDNYLAGCLAVYLHAKACDLQVAKFGERGLIATDLLLEIRKLLNQKL